jgi:hypothetical protein
MLATAQPRHRRLVGGIDGEVVATEAFDRNDLADTQSSDRDVDRVAGDQPSSTVECHESWSTRWAAHRLRMESPVGRVVVLRLTRPAHREASHRRTRPVVGDVADDRVARTAIGAVGERVAEAALGGLADLSHAVRTATGVGGDQGIAANRRLARNDHEAGGPANSRQVPAVNPIDAREWWRITDQPIDEVDQQVRRSLDLDEHA